MKNIFLVIGLLLSAFTYSQTTGILTTTLAVKGNCEQCKERIENAADIKGVKNAKWDAKTQILTVTFNSEKTSAEKIQQAIAKSGHDSGSEKAPDQAYQKLPDCCKYRDHGHDGK